MKAFFPALKTSSNLNPKNMPFVLNKFSAGLSTTDRKYKNISFDFENGTQIKVKIDEDNYVFKFNELSIVPTIASTETETYQSETKSTTVSLDFYVIDWGDGSNSIYWENSIVPFHTYEKSGTYTISITNNISKNLLFKDSKSVIETLTLGNKLTNISAMFCDCTNLSGKIPALHEGLTCVNDAFKNCTSLNGVTSTNSETLMPSTISSYTGFVEGCSEDVIKYYYEDWGGTLTSEITSDISTETSSDTDEEEIIGDTSSDIDDTTTSSAIDPTEYVSPLEEYDNTVFEVYWPTDKLGEEFSGITLLYSDTISVDWGDGSDIEIINVPEDSSGITNNTIDYLNGLYSINLSGHIYPSYNVYTITVAGGLKSFEISKNTTINNISCSNSIKAIPLINQSTNLYSFTGSEILSVFGSFTNCPNLETIKIPNAEYIGDYLNQTPFTNSPSVELEINNITIEQIQNMDGYPWGLHEDTYILALDGDFFANESEDTEDNPYVYVTQLNDNQDWTNSFRVTSLPQYVLDEDSELTALSEFRNQPGYFKKDDETIIYNSRVVSVMCYDTSELTALNDNALAYCSYLENVNLPSVTYLGENALAYNIKLSSVVLGEITGGHNAFAECYMLESITLGNTLDQLTSEYTIGDTTYSSMIEAFGLPDTVKVTFICKDDETYYYEPGDDQMEDEE